MTGDKCKTLHMLFYFLFEHFSCLDGAGACFFLMCVWWSDMSRSSPLLQYCSSRLVLSYRLPHEDILSDILPSSLIPSLLPALPPLDRLLCPLFTPLRLFFTPSPLPVSPTFINRQTHTHKHLYLPQRPVTASVKLHTIYPTTPSLSAFKIKELNKITAALWSTWNVFSCYFQWGRSFSPPVVRLTIC